MRIALIQYSSNYGGSTLSGEMIAQAMLDRGHDVDVVFGFDGPFVDRMSHPNCRTHVVAHANWLRRRGIVRFGRNLATERESARRMATLFQRLDTDLVYVNSLVSYAGARGASERGIPVVWHLRELFSDQFGEMNWPAEWAKFLVRRTIRNLATRLVVNSDAVRRHVLGDPVNDATIIPNAVPDAYFEDRISVPEARETFAIPSDVTVIGFPGTLRPVKGHATFFHAIPQILDHHPQCHFLISGVIDSEFARDLTRQAASYTFADRIHFTGNVSDMRSFYRACDVCCIASKSESFGRTAIEAFAMRVPLVSTTVGGLSEILDDGTNCLTFSVGDSGGLAGQTHRMLQDKQLMQRLASNAYADAKQRFSQRACADAIESVVSDARSLFNGKSS